MKVYHGGTVVVKEPLAGIGRAGLDFGQGFYVLSIGSKLVSGHPVWLTVDNSLRF